MRFAVVIGILYLLSFCCCAPVCAAERQPAQQIEIATLERQIRLGKANGDTTARLESMLKANPNDSRAHYLLGMTLEHQGFIELANQEYTKADKLAPSGEGSALRVFETKWESYGAATALQFLEFVASQTPNDPAVLLMRASAAARGGDVAGAERIYKEALIKHGDTVGTASAYSAFMLSQGNYAEAVKLANHDLDLKTDYVPALLNKGEGLLDEGRYLPSLPLIQHVFETTHKHDEKQRAAELLCRIYLYQGMAKAALEPALIAFELNIDRDSQTKTLTRQYLVSSVRSVSLEALAKSLQQSLEQTTEYDEEFRLNLLLALAEILDNNGKKQAAQNLYKQCLQIQPGSAQSYYCLGRLAEEKGQLEEARNFYKRACDLAPQASRNRAAYQRILSRVKNANRDLAREMKGSS